MSIGTTVCVVGAPRMIWGVCGDELVSRDPELSAFEVVVLAPLFDPFAVPDGGLDPARFWVKPVTVTMVRTVVASAAIAAIPTTLTVRRRERAVKRTFFQRGRLLLPVCSGLFLLSW